MKKDKENDLTSRDLTSRDLTIMNNGFCCVYQLNNAYQCKI